MNILDLKYAILLAKEKNFTEAAKKSNISQAALSKHINKIEQILGITLFDRSKRPLALTLAGKEFLSHAKILLDEYNNMLHSMEKYSLKDEHILNIGILPIIGRLGFTPYFKEFKDSLKSNEDIKFIDRPSKDLWHMLDSGEIDLALMPTITDIKTDGKFIVYPILETELCLIVANSHPLSKRSSVNLNELIHERFAILDEKTSTFELINHLCKTENVTLSNIVKFQNSETVLDMVAYDNYLSFLTSRALASYQHYKGILKAIHLSPPVKSNVSIVMLQTNKFSVLQKKFLDFIQNCNFNN